MQEEYGYEKEKSSMGKQKEKSQRGCHLPKSLIWVIGITISLERIISLPNAGRCLIASPLIFM